MAMASNQRVRRIIRLLTIGVTLCVILVGRTAPAAEQIDQSNLPEWAGGWTHVNPTSEGQAAMWQTFRPACTNVIAVAIDILTNNPGQGDDVLTVEIAKDGDVLASAESSVADGFDGLLRFEFLEAVPLIPEQIYELKVRDTGKTRFGWKYGPNTYERGSRYVFAQERPGSDWFFQTYSNVEQAHAKYSGGTGEPNDPYQIATAADLIVLGETPEDYDKHFIVTADIDLDPNLPGRKVFGEAIIAPGTSAVPHRFVGTPFTGVFDGNGHVISHMTITGESYLGLFGQLGNSNLASKVMDLGILDANITGSGDYAGVLVGCNFGNILTSFSTGVVAGGWYVGGLAGSNPGRIVNSYSASIVTGTGGVGGLVGNNTSGDLSQCYSTGMSTGGGLVGMNCYYSETMIDLDCGSVTNCFWDIQTSGPVTSDGGIGKTTTEMQMVSTFYKWGCEPIWTINEGNDYPRLRWENKPGEIIEVVSLADILLGTGTKENPYLIYTPEELNMVGLSSCEFDKYFKLMSDIDLSDYFYDAAVIAPTFSEWPARIQGTGFTGTFDGNGHTVSNITIEGDEFLGLFGRLEAGAEVMNLGVENINITSSSDYSGGLVGCNLGNVTRCYSTGRIDGKHYIGGLVGCSDGGQVTQCYSTVEIFGDWCVGGLAGLNGGDLSQCYSAGIVSSIGEHFGGLVGSGLVDRVTACFWDIQTSGQAESAGGMGKTTAEMQAANTFLDAGWDFVGETANGTDDIWWILEGKDYPRLWWELPCEN